MLAVSIANRSPLFVSLASVSAIKLYLSELNGASKYRPSQLPWAGPISRITELSRSTEFNLSGLQKHTTVKVVPLEGTLTKAALLSENDNRPRSADHEPAEILPGQCLLSAASDVARRPRDHTADRLAASGVCFRQLAL